MVAIPLFRMEVEAKRSQLWKKTNGLKQAKELLRDFEGPSFAGVFATSVTALNTRVPGSIPGESFGLPDQFPLNIAFV